MFSSSRDTANAFDKILGLDLQCRLTALAVDAERVAVMEGLNPCAPDMSDDDRATHDRIVADALRLLFDAGSDSRLQFTLFWWHVALDRRKFSRSRCSTVVLRRKKPAVRGIPIFEGLLRCPILMAEREGLPRRLSKLNKIKGLVVAWLVCTSVVP
jgi:hypothetical protein